MMSETSDEYPRTNSRGGKYNSSDVDKCNKEALLVTVRVRPFTDQELASGEQSVCKVLGSKVIVMKLPDENFTDVLRVNRSREKRYAFDHVFDESVTQQDVYRNTTKFLISGVLSGINATCFAYGMTGSGKTHTMLGTVQDVGVIELTLRKMYREIRKSSDEFNYEVKVSYLEIYNELIRDLLNDSDVAPESLELREDPIRGPIVTGITEVPATSVTDIISQVRSGNKRRTVEPTLANKHSSRSHAILQVHVCKTSNIPNIDVTVKTSKLSLIDLAGSERASKTSNTGMRMVEGAKINRSLLALGNCINALGGKSQKGQYINYRDSKLTRLLKDSLGGNCRTVMVAHISCLRSHFDESLNTLSYANRAKNIKAMVTRNVLNVSYHIAQYTNIIGDLRGEILSLRERLAGPNRKNLDNASSLTSPKFSKLYDAIQSTLNERVILRRELIQAEDQSVQGAIEVNQLALDIQRLEEEGGLNDVQGTNPALEELRSGLTDARARQTEEQERKTLILSKLASNKDAVQSYEFDMRELTFDKNWQRSFDAMFNSHILRLQNLELESNSALYEDITEQNLSALQRLEQALRLRDEIIGEQTALLTANGIMSEKLSDLKNLLDDEDISEITPAKSIQMALSARKQQNNLSSHLNVNVNNMLPAAVLNTNSEGKSGEVALRKSGSSSASKFPYSSDILKRTRTKGSSLRPHPPDAVSKTTAQLQSGRPMQYVHPSSTDGSNMREGYVQSPSLIGPAVRSRTRLVQNSNRKSVMPRGAFQPHNQVEPRKSILKGDGNDDGDAGKSTLSTKVRKSKITVKVPAIPVPSRIVPSKKKRRHEKVDSTTIHRSKSAQSTLLLSGGSTVTMKSRPRSSSEDVHSVPKSLLPEVNPSNSNTTTSNMIAYNNAVVYSDISDDAMMADDDTSSIDPVTDDEMKPFREPIEDVPPALEIQARKASILLKRKLLEASRFDDTDKNTDNSAMATDAEVAPRPILNTVNIKTYKMLPDDGSNSNESSKVSTVPIGVASA